jgi:hypothetical protein
MGRTIRMGFIIVGFVAVFATLGAAQQTSPLLWGPVLGAIGPDSVAVTWNTSRPAGADLRYSTAQSYEANKSWEETLSFDRHAGPAEVELTGLESGTTYLYQLVIYEGDAVYTSKVGRFATPTADETSFSFLVAGDAAGDPAQAKLVADAMAANDPDAAFVLSTGGLVQSASVSGFATFFAAISDLALSHPYLPVVGQGVKSDASYYSYFALPAGGGDSNEEWWSFDYGDVHIVGLDTTVLGEPNGSTRMQTELQWARTNLAASDARYKIVLMNAPLYSSNLQNGEDAALVKLWAPVFQETGVQVVFSDTFACYEHLFVDGTHYLVTGGAGAPPIAAPGTQIDSTVSARYGTLHYVRVSVSKDGMQVAMVPVAAIYGGQAHPIPDATSPDSFTVTGSP